MYKCYEKAGPNQIGCKQNCYKKVIVPYKFYNHASRDEEENLYRKCLAEKFPNITQLDYISCTNKIYKDRVKILSGYMAEVSERILATIH